ncbi:hypothetical protein Aperf_G00000014903 [Anoplocephala perfoliata]
MGCSSSSPEAVINEFTATTPSGQNGAGDVNKGSASVKFEGASSSSLPKIEEIEGKAKGTSLKESKSVATEEKTTLFGITEDKYEAQDTNPRCNELEIPDAAKQGYVAYEVNLDGEFARALNDLKKQLPKRLERLEPLPEAPKLTAEELNEGLERAVRQHRRALAMQKRAIIRRFKKGSNQTGDISDSAPINDLSAENETSRTSTNGAEVDRETLDGSQDSKTTHQTVDSMMVDLNKKSNVATERREGLEKLCHGHLLHAVTEVEEDME